MFLAAAIFVALQSPYDARAFDLPGETVATLQRGLDGYLRDSPATRFRGTRGPRRGSFTGGYDGVPREGAIYCVQINGKNAFGAYIGFQDYVVVVAEDGAVYPFERMDRHLKNTSRVDAECRLPADDSAPL